MRLWPPWKWGVWNIWVVTSSHGKKCGWGTVGYGACAAEDGRCDPGPTTSWSQAVNFYRTWRSSTHNRTRTINWSCVASAEQPLPRNHDISGNTHVSPSSHQQPQTGLTACFLSSGRKFPSHPSRNACARHGSQCKHGVLLTPGLQHARTGTSGTPGGPAAKSRQSSSKSTGSKERPRRDQH